jgi:CubicO group peptidase (beta-lactamase class C family)
MNELYPVRVADCLFIVDGYHQKIYNSIASSELRKEKEYKYSDLGYYWVPQIVENHLNERFDKALENQFYSPLNMHHTCFLPRNYFDLNQIVPTENDTIFRKQLVHGDVHDQGAAMLGGISGHAGLFSTAEDLAILFQMYLQQGFYGGRRYIEAETVKEFTRYQFDGNKNRRGIGFDKPLKNYTPNGPVCQGASTKSFGHSGFTGTYVWADPAEDLIFVFLSNRVYPYSSNLLLSKLNVRTEIHQEIYNSITTHKSK